MATRFDPDPAHVDKITVTPACLKDLGQHLVDQIVSIVKKYPTGIASKSLFAQLKKMNPYKMPPNFEALIQKYGPQFAFMQKISYEHQEILYFPKWLDGLIVSPLEMFANIWHKLQVVVNLKLGIVKLSKAFSLCCDIFGWNKIVVSVWGFYNDADFVRFLIHSFGNHLRLISELDIKENGKQDIFYLITAANQEQKRLISSHLQKTSTISKGIVSQGNSKDSGQSTSNTNPYKGEIQSNSAWNRNPQYNNPSISQTNASYRNSTQQLQPKLQSGWKGQINKAAVSQNSMSPISTSAFPALGELPKENIKKSSNVPQKPKSWNKLF